MSKSNRLAPPSLRPRFLVAKGLSGARGLGGVASLDLHVSSQERREEQRGSEGSGLYQEDTDNQITGWLSLSSCRGTQSCSWLSLFCSAASVIVS